jgi:hypothetical protein
MHDFYMPEVIDFTTPKRSNILEYAIGEEYDS